MRVFERKDGGTTKGCASVIEDTSTCYSKAGAKAHLAGGGLKEDAMRGIVDATVEAEE